MKLHLRVRSRQGQSALRILRKENLVDNDYEILHEEGFLMIPLMDGAIIPEIENSETVELDEMERRTKPSPKGIKGSYDVIGSIVILKKSTTRNPKEIAGRIVNRPGISSVYLDSGVTGEYRKRSLELIAGEDNTVTLYRENGILLKVDVENAYFSPRLATERMLVADSIRDGEEIVDMFAGIGPFSVLIARRHQCHVKAIDHNPRAIELLKENISLNKLKGTITPVMGRSEDEISEISGVDRVIMNLPHGAVPFIGGAMDALKEGGRINFYEVSSVEGITERMISLKKLGLKLVSKREVHGYSKSEYMYSLELVKSRS